MSVHYSQCNKIFAMQNGKSISIFIPITLAVLMTRFFGLFVFVVVDLNLFGCLNAWISCTRILSRAEHVPAIRCRLEKKEWLLWKECSNSVHCIPPIFPIFWIRAVVWIEFRGRGFLEVELFIWLQEFV